MNDWDTVIIGAGSAGCALAARLSEDARRRVLLLEAGPKDLNLMFRIPAGNFSVIGNPKYDWALSTEPEPNLEGRRISWPRGKVLGGSSAINGLIAARGQPEDYDGWRGQGCVGWGWSDVLPYFIRLEDYEGPADELHGAGGPLPVSRGRGRHPVHDAYLAAALELGIPHNHDFNGVRQEGAGHHHVNVSRGWIPVRVSSAAGYLGAARRRPNLKIVVDAEVQRIVFDGRRAAAVLYERGGTLHEARAQAEIVLAAGAVFSPHLLELSGIGDARRLRALGIEVVQDLPAVGRNLQDHLQSLSVYRVNIPTFNDKVRTVAHKLKTVLEGLILQQGAYYGVSHFGFFVRSDPRLERPDVQLHVHAASGSFKKPHAFSGLSVSAYPLRPESRGRIETRSPDPKARPAIFANYLATEKDRTTAVAALRMARRLAETAAVRPLIEEEIQPGAGVMTDDDMLEYLRRTADTVFHPVGTCRMGSDATSVVDPELRVRGLMGLYVADASVMPTLVSSSTHLPCVMIGEKASDLIRAHGR